MGYARAQAHRIYRQVPKYKSFSAAFCGRIQRALSRQKAFALACSAAWRSAAVAGCARTYDWPLASPKTDGHIHLRR